MFRPKNSQKSAYYRLPKMQSQIGENELQFLLSESAVRKGCTIELPFQPGSAIFMLTVRLGEDSYEPMWTFYEGDDQNAKVIWQHPTGDIYLVLNLIRSDSLADNYMAAGPGGFSGAAGKPGAGSELRPPTEFNAVATQPIPNMIAPPTNKVASVEGDLSNMQMPTLLQSISMSKMTGKLLVNSDTTQAWIFIDDGLPVHAVTNETTGDAAIVELITWEEGQFHFYPSEKTSERTVNKRVDSLLMEGITLLDQHKYLQERALKPQAYLYQRNANISEDEFRIMLTRGSPLDLELQKKVYRAAGSGKTFMDVLRLVPLIKTEWIPIMFNMISCGLLEVSQDAPVMPTLTAAASATPAAAPLEIDRTAIQGVVRTLTRAETAIFSYPAYLYFVEQEFLKCQGFGMPLSLIVLEPFLHVGDSLQPLPTQFTLTMLRRIEALKRPFDILGHFETFDYAMALPNANAKSAKAFATQLMQALAADPFVPRATGSLHIAFGLASAPEDTHDLPTLLAAAKEAKIKARESGNSITAFRDIQQR